MKNKNVFAKELLQDFISELFSSKLNKYIYFENMPEFSFERELTADEIKIKFDESEKLISEGKGQEAGEILRLISKSIGAIREDIKVSFEFECNQNKYLAYISKESIYFNFNLYLILDNNATYNNFSNSLKKDIAKFNSTLNSIVFISNDFLELLDQFKEFKIKNIDFINEINKNSFIEKNSSQYYNLFKKWKNFLTINNYINGNQYIYNDLDNKAIYINDTINEYIYHEDQTSHWLHILEKNTNNFKIISLNHLFIFNEDIDEISFEEFEKNKNLTINQINDEFFYKINEEFLIFDSTRGLNLKSDFSNALKYNIELLHYL